MYFCVCCLPAQVMDIKQDIAGWKNHVMWGLAEQENKKEITVVYTVFVGKLF